MWLQMLCTPNICLVARNVVEIYKRFFVSEENFYCTAVELIAYLEAFLTKEKFRWSLIDACNVYSDLNESNVRIFSWKEIGHVSLTRKVSLDLKLEWSCSF